MRVSFVETMRGTLIDARGSHPAEFRVKAEAGGLRQMLRDGVLRLAGVVHMPPFATNAPATGSMRVDAAARHLHYDLTFDGLRLAGHKTVRLRAVLATMTLLPVTLFDGAGQELAHGDLRFPLATLRPFLLSFFGVGRPQQHLDAERRGLERRRLDGES